MELLDTAKWQKKLMPQSIVRCMLRIKRDSVLMEVKCEFLYSGQNMLQTAADLRCRVYFPVEGLATDIEGETTPWLVNASDYRSTVTVEKDFGGATMKTFACMDELGQVCEGIGDFKE
jgi:hypothetical protein